MSKKLIGFSALFITSLLFGSYGLWIRILSTQLSAYQLITFRYAIGTIVLLAVIFLRREKISLIGIPKLHLALFSISLPISFILFTFSMMYTKISVATVGFYLGTILLGFILGAIVFKEKLKLLNLLDLVLAIIGLSIMLYPFSLANLNFGFIIGIFSGVFYSIGSVFKKSLQNKISRLWLITIIAVFCVIITLPFVMLSANPIPPALNTEVILVAGIYTLIALSAEYLTIVGFQNFDLNWGSVILSGEIVFAGLIGLFFFQETLSSRELIGLAFITLAVLLPQLSFVNKKNNKRSL